MENFVSGSDGVCEAQAWIVVWWQISGLRGILQKCENFDAWV